MAYRVPAKQLLDNTTRRPLWFPRTTPHVDDQNFDIGINGVTATTLPTGWEVFNYSSGNVATLDPSPAVQPYTGLGTADRYRMSNDNRQSFLSMQFGFGAATQQYFTGFKPSGGVPTNRAVLIDLALMTRFGGDLVDCDWGIIITDGTTHSNGLAGNSVLFATDNTTGNVMRAAKVTAGAYAAISTGPNLSAGAQPPADYAMIQKAGSTYYFWTFNEDGQKQSWESTTHATSMTWIGFYTRAGAHPSGPGAAICNCDLMWHSDSAVYMPT